MRLRRYRGRHLIERPHPFAKPAVAGTATAVLAAGPAHAGTHRIRQGETLSGIAAKYSTSVTRLTRMNDLQDPNFIVAGLKLRVPGSTSSAVTYEVRAGDNLSSVAHKHGVSIARIVKANKIADQNLIVIGQKLKIPGRPSGSTRKRSATKVSLPSTSTSEVAVILDQEAAGQGLDASLVKALAWQESGWQQDVVSKAGAIGVMQVMPGTARYVNRVLGGGGLNVRATRDNVRLGVIYLHHMMHSMPTLDKTLAAYYTGPGNVKRRLNKIQRSYVRSVKALRARF
jgi:LysM repeat protein